MKSGIQIQLGKITLVLDDNKNSDNNTNSNNDIDLMLDGGQTLHLTEVGSTLSTPSFMVVYTKRL